MACTKVFAFSNLYFLIHEQRATCLHFIYTQEPDSVPCLPTWHYISGKQKVEEDDNVNCFEYRKLANEPFNMFHSKNTI